MDETTGTLDLGRPKRSRRHVKGPGVGRQMTWVIKVRMREKDAIPRLLT